VTDTALSALGWTAELDDQFRTIAPENARPARVSRVDRGGVSLITDTGLQTATLAGRLFHQPDAHIAVGDWVVLQDSRVIAILPRRTVLQRSDAGSETVEQAIAANVDVVFVVASLAAKLRPGRIERYLALVWSSGAEPVLVLNKADACPDLEAAVRAATAVATGVRVHTVSAQDGSGMDALAAECAGNRTCALVGPSGVGKSTIINYLTGTDSVATGAVRDDGKGRHTTTWRELVPLPGGGALLDTPGLRGLSLWDGGDGTFTDIAELAGQCRFTDCQHRTEPGCAILAAIAAGTLDADRLQRYRKMQREQAWLEERKDARARAERTAELRANARRRNREARSARRHS
jgi:ribosome biogenesis GTPase / thiamine phosphate phosphatase